MAEFAPGYPRLGEVRINGRAVGPSMMRVLRAAYAADRRGFRAYPVIRAHRARMSKIHAAYGRRRR